MLLVEKSISEIFLISYENQNMEYEVLPLSLHYFEINSTSGLKRCTIWWLYDKNKTEKVYNCTYTVNL